MQILKEEVRNRILQAARTEFAQHGFIRTSVRGIAKAAGITPGNIYRYFQDKDALFGALLESTHQQFQAHMLQLMAEIDERLIDCLPLPAIGEQHPLDETVRKLVQFMRNSSVEMMLLFTQSEGSAYAQVKVDSTDLITRILQRVFSIPVTQDLDADRELQIQNSAEMLAHTLMEGLCHILRQHRDAATINVLMDQLLSVYSSGLAHSLYQIQAQQKTCSHKE